MNSPRDLIESQFPSYFLEQYPQFVKFIEEYYDFLESSIAILDDKKACKVGDILYGSLSKAKAIVKIIADDKIYFDYETQNNNFYKNEIVLNGTSGQTYFIKNLYKNIYSFARDIEENTAYDTVQNMFKKYFKRNISLDHSIFSRLDPNTLTKKILDYYKNRGTENSYYWFFRIFFDDVIDLYYPKVDILRLSDTNHIERRWMQIEYNPRITKFEKTRIKGSKSKATATVRGVQTKIRENEYKYFLDLIYVNGKFLPDEEIIGYDIITSEELVKGKILKSISGLKVEDGGIGHKVGDEFTFSDGIGFVSHLEKYSITDVSIINSGNLYGIGDYVNFENEYTDATAFANAHVVSIIPNYILSDYVNYLSNTLNYNANTSLFPQSELFKHLTSNVISNTNTTPDYKFFGSIDKIQINKSGLNYRFVPNATIKNNDIQSQNLYSYELYLDTVNSNTNHLVKDSIVIINNTPVVYAGSQIISNEEVYFEDIDVLIEDPFLSIFYGPDTLSQNIANSDVKFYQNNNSVNYANLLTNNYNVNDLLSIDIININANTILNENAKLSPSLGEGVSKIKITNPGFMVKHDDPICFISGPKKRTIESNNTIQFLDTKFSYNEDVLFESIEEYIDTNSNLSSDKHIQDNYYYQNFSYEITTKIPAEVIEPLLLDELHPAGFIAFIRNKIDAEVSMHLKAYEFPRIELLSEAEPFNTDIKPYMVQMQEQFVNMNYDEMFKDYLYTEVEIDNTDYGTIQNDLVEAELENNDLIDIFEGFRIYVEDCLIRPDSKSFQEFRKCDSGPFFDTVDTYFFDGNQDSSNVAFFDSDGTCIPTGYGTSSEYSRLEQEYMHYDGMVAFESFLKIINVEDSANWKTDPILRYKGTIGSRLDYEINNHKAIVQDIVHIATNHNIGGKIVVRDWMGAASKFRFDNEMVYFDANTVFDPSKNFSGEFFNYTENPFFLFDSTDANNLIHDFSNTNIQNLICFTSHHDHNSMNFSNEPAVSYIPMVSGNTLANKGSYLPTTEVLTKDKGYVQIQDLKLEDHVAFVKDDGKVIWRKPDEIIKQQYNGMMYQFTDYNRISITVTPNQDLVIYDDELLPNFVKAQKIKSDRINLPRTPDSFALIDPSLAGTVNSAIIDYVPIDKSIHKNIKKYNGLVYCLIFNEYKESIPIETKINNVDVELLQLYSKINNDYTLPKFQPIDITYINHDKYENHITVNIQKNDFILQLPTSNSILFDFNTNKELDTYVSFKSEAGLINATKILNTNGVLFDNAVQPTFDSDQGIFFDNTAQRFQVKMERMYHGMNHVLTKVPKGHEQIIQYTKETEFDYFGYIDGNLPKVCLGASEDKQEILVSNVNIKSYVLNSVLDNVDVYLNGVLLHESKDYEIIGNLLNILILLNLNDVITVQMKSAGVCNTMSAELYTYEELKIEPQEIKYTPIEKLITETSFLLYPKLFGPKVTFDLATLSPPNCLNGSFDYYGANTSVYKFDSNTSALSFDYDKDACVKTSPEFPLNRYITFDSERRSFDQTNDYFVKTEQYVEPEQILTNSADQYLTANNENSAGMRNMNPPTEFVRIGENFGNSIVATIKNYRVDLKKKFFDSLIWTFDRNYTTSRLNPLEHSGFDNVETPNKLDLDCVHLFFDNDSLPLDRTTIGYVTQDFSPKTFAETGISFDDDNYKFDRFGYLYKDCSIYEIPFPYDNDDLNISYKLINDTVISGYGPYNYSSTFDSSEPGHGFDKHNYPFFDNEKGDVKPFVYPENKIINVDFQDISVASGRNDPLQTLILTAEDAYKRELEVYTEQFLINWNQIVICTQDVIRYDDVISDFEFSLIWRYLYEQGCDPSSTKGTFAYPDYYLINAPEETLHTEISENQSILYRDAIFIDGTSSVYEIHNEVDIITDVLSCDPIRYTDVIYGHRKDKIHPYIYDTCPGDDRILRAETDFEFVLINEDLYYSNTEIYEPHEIEIYSHERNDLYPNKMHLFANNDIIDTVIRPEIEVHQHLGNRNCAISIGDLIYDYVDTNILNCHLKETLRYWTMDTIPVVSAIPSSVLKQSSNTKFYTEFQKSDTLYLNPLFADSTSVLTEYTHDEDIPISIIDRNPFIWTGQIIGSRIDDFIAPKMVSNKILDYVDDKIPSVSVRQMTQIRSPRHIHSNTYFNVSNTIFTETKENFIDASITNDDTEQWLSSFDDILDRNPLININRPFNSRIDDLITDYIKTKPIVDYDGDYIPSVTAKGFQVINGVHQNYSNSEIETYSTFYSKESLVDASFESYENFEIEYHRFVPDRNVVINVNKPFSLKLDKLIEDNLLGKPIVDYDGDRIPSVTVDSRPSIEFQRVLTHDLESNTFQSFNLTFEDMYLESTFNFNEYTEIEHDKNLYSDWKFISADRDIIRPHYNDIIGKRLDFTIRDNRYDTSRTAKVFEQHEIEEYLFIEEVANVYQDTIITFPETNYIDSTFVSEEFDEIEYDREICDIYSIIPLNQRVLGTRWEDMTIAAGVLNNEIKENGDGCIPIVTVDFRPSIETQRVEYHDLQRSLSQEFTFTFPETILDATSYSKTEYDELELEMIIPDRHKFIDLTDVIDLYYIELPINTKKVITDYDKFAIPTVTVDSKPSIEMQRVQKHNLQSNTKQEFATSPIINHIDATFEYREFNEIEYLTSLLNIEPYFDLTQKIKPFNLNPTEYGELLYNELIGDNLLNKILIDYSGDKNFVNIVTQEPHFERLYVENGYFLPEYANGNFLKSDTIINDNKISFIDATMFNDDTTEEIERDLIIWNDNHVFSLAEEIDEEILKNKLDRERHKRLIDDLSYHTAVITSFEPTIINRPIYDMQPEFDPETILSSKDLDMFIDATIDIYNNQDDKSLHALITNLFEDLSPTVFEAIPTIINRPIEKTSISAFLDTIISAEHFEKFIDSSADVNELFTHINLDSFNDLELNANSITTENKLINRPNEIIEIIPSIETILKGDYFEKFIDSSSTVCSELYEYNHVKTSNVILKDVANIPWFSSNVANGNNLNQSWVFSTNSSNNTTNTQIYFSTAGPDYQLDSEPTYIDLAFATKTLYGIPTANNGYLTANGWQYIDQQDPIPIPTANLGFESNRTIKMAIFEKYEFVITDIANTHNGYFFAVGTSPWSDNNREANVMFGSANGVTYELDGVIYTDFNKYKTDFVSGLKANAKITFAPTLSIAQLLGSDANTVNGANSELCPNYNVYSANTYTFYYWSNANNTVYSAGGEIEIYELNNLEECINYSINKTSYIDNIRVRKEIMCA